VLVYYEECADKEAALTREKQIKHLLRWKKIELIRHMNPEWHDLYDGLVG